MRLFTVDIAQRISVVVVAESREDAEEWAGWEGSSLISEVIPELQIHAMEIPLDGCIPNGWSRDTPYCTPQAEELLNQLQDQLEKERGTRLPHTLTQQTCDQLLELIRKLEKDAEAQLEADKHQTKFDLG